MRVRAHRRAGYHARHGLWVSRERGTVERPSWVQLAQLAHMCVSSSVRLHRHLHCYTLHSSSTTPATICTATHLHCVLPALILKKTATHPRCYPSCAPSSLLPTCTARPAAPRCPSCPLSSPARPGCPQTARMHACLNVNTCLLALVPVHPQQLNCTRIRGCAGGSAGTRKSNERMAACP